MRKNSLADIRKELNTLSQKDVMALCVRLAKHRKESKELLSYLLFGMHNEDAYMESVKSDIAEALHATNLKGFYLAKKSIRRALRIADKHIRFSGRDETTLELLLFFCDGLLTLDLDIKKSKVLTNLYHRQVERIEKAFAALHEDLQYDYAERVNRLKDL